MERQDKADLSVPFLGPQRSTRLPLGPLYATSFLRATATTLALLPALSLRVNEFAALAGYDAASAAKVLGLIFALRRAAEFLSVPVLAAWSDRAGRRRVLLASGAAFAVESLLLATARSLPLFALAHVAGGLFASGSAVESSCVADATLASPQRAVATGRLFTMLGAALAVGPAVSGQLLRRCGSSSPFLCAHALALVGLLATAACLPEYLPPERRSGIAARRRCGLGSVAPLLRLLAQSPGLAWHAAGMVANSLNFSAYTTINVLWVKAAFGWDGEDVGHFIAFVGIVVMFSQTVLLPCLIKALRGRESLLVQACLAVNAAKFAAYAVAPSGRWLYVAVLATAPSYCCMPVLSSLCTRCVPEAHQGLWAGSQSALNTAASIVGSAIGSQLLAAALRGRCPLATPLFFVAASQFVTMGCIVRARRVGGERAKAEGEGRP